MCGSKPAPNVEVKVPRPTPPPDPAPAVAPVIPVQQVAAAPVSLREKDNVGVRPERRLFSPSSPAMRQGTSQLRMPLNTGVGGTSGGLNA